MSHDPEQRCDWCGCRRAIGHFVATAFGLMWQCSECTRTRS